jgi:glyoxylase-like metal-dependent hydrolase (beta-lactamase superfamily II)
VTDIVITHMPVDHVGGLLVDEVRNQLRPDVRIHVAAAEVASWATPDFTQTVMPAAVPDVLRSTATQSLNVYRSQLHIFEEECEVAPGVLVWRTGGHTPGRSVVRLTLLY